MEASKLEWATKEQGQENPNPPEKKFVFTEVNELVTKFDANADIIDTNTAAILLRLIASNNLSDVLDAATALANLGGYPIAGGTLTGPMLGDQSARLYRPQSESALNVDTNLSTLTQNTTILVNTSPNDVTITVDDSANSLPIGTTFEFIHRVGANDVVFAASGDQSILSADDNLKIRTKYAAAILTKQINNVWYLIGDLKA